MPMFCTAKCEAKLTIRIFKIGRLLIVCIIACVMRTRQMASITIFTASRTSAMTVPYLRLRQISSGQAIRDICSIMNQCTVVIACGDHGRCHLTEQMNG